MRSGVTPFKAGDIITIKEYSDLYWFVVEDTKSNGEMKVISLNVNPSIIHTATQDIFTWKLITSILRENNV